MINKLSLFIKSAAKPNLTRYNWKHLIWISNCSLFQLPGNNVTELFYATLTMK